MPPVLSVSILRAHMGAEYPGSRISFRSRRKMSGGSPLEGQFSGRTDDSRLPRGRVPT